MLKRTLSFLLFLVPALVFASDAPTPEPADVVVPAEEQPAQAEALPAAEGEAAVCSEVKEDTNGLPSLADTAESWGGERVNRACQTRPCVTSNICDWFCGGVGVCQQNCCECV